MNRQINTFLAPCINFLHFFQMSKSRLGWVFHNYICSMLEMNVNLLTLCTISKASEPGGTLINFPNFSRLLHRKGWEWNGGKGRKDGERGSGKAGVCMCLAGQAVTVDSVVQWWQDTGSDCSLSSPSTPSTMLRSVSRCLPSSHLQPGPFLPGGPQSRQKHTLKNNTQRPRDTQSHSQGRGVTPQVRLARHGAANMQLDKVENRKGAQTLSLYFLSSPSPHFINLSLP